MIKKENYQEWLDSLQVGKKVAMDTGSLHFTKYAIATITKITPKRRISTSNNMTFNADGSEYGKKSSWDKTSRIEPVTQKILDRIERSSLLSKVKNTKFEECSLEQLRQIATILGK